MHHADDFGSTEPTSFMAIFRSSLPVPYSDYNSAMLLVNDGDFEISWTAAATFNSASTNTATTSPSWHSTRNDIGMDYDSMVLDGGTAHYLKAQTIVATHKTRPTGGAAGQSKPLLVG